MKAYVSGVPDSDVEHIRNALDIAYGEIDLEVIDAPSRKLLVRMCAKDSSVVFVCFSDVDLLKVSNIAGDLSVSDKFYEYTSSEALLSYLEETFDGFHAPAEVSEGLEEVAEASEGVSEASKEEEAPREIPRVSGTADYDIVPNLFANDDEDFEPEEDASDEVNEEAVEEASEESSGGASEEPELPVKPRDDSSSLVIENLYEQIEEYKDALHSISLLQSPANQQGTADLEEKLAARDSQIADLREQLSKLNTELTKSTSDLVIVQSKLDHAKLDLSNAQTNLLSLTSEKEKSARLQSRVSELEDTCAALTGDKITLEASVKGLNAQIDSLKSSLAEPKSVSDEEFDRLVDYKDSLEEKIKNLESDLATSQSSYMNAVQEKDSALLSLSDWQNKVSILENTVKSLQLKGTVSKTYFGKMELHSKSFVDTAPSLTDAPLPRFKRLQFVFAGSKEVNIETYRHIRKSLQENAKTSDKLLLVDLSTESYVDSLFKSASVSNNTDWLKNGGSISSFLNKKKSSTLDMAAIETYSIATSQYFNELSLFNIDWLSRLSELSESGYRVMVYGGDMSSLFGKAFYRSIEKNNKSSIFVRGNGSSSRSLYYSLASSNATTPANTSIYMYDFIESLPSATLIRDYIKSLGFPVTVISVYKRPDHA